MKFLIIIFLSALPALSLAQRKTDTPKYLMPPAAADTAAAKPKSALELLWKSQTVSGQNAVTEKVTVGFFSTGTGAGIYAFHNAAPRGTVLRVTNLGNGRMIYVKVLGPIPATKQFQGCSLGLTNTAKTALDVRNSKAFCEISYLGY